MADRKPTVIAIVGPTGSGKTGLSLPLAETLNGEIIACDSRTVYRHFDIGTAKPSKAEQSRVPHHLIDVAQPDEDFTVAQFTELAGAAIHEMTARGKLPIVCGGTGFYARALLEGLDIPAVPPQIELRRELQDFADREGNEALHQRLTEIDPVSASRLNANDRFRVVRAIEVSTVCGEPFSQLARKRDPDFNTIWIGLNASDRNHLYAVIKERLHQQVAEGLLEEVQSLYKRYGPHQKMMHTVNYRQYVQHIEGMLDSQQAFDEALKHNNHLARRQLIWFRANPQIKWFAIDELDKTQLLQAVQAYLEDRR
jgi:tRNA dimethylallyltransferase